MAYRCSKCGGTIEYGIERCPHCNVKLSFAKKTVEIPVPAVEETPKKEEVVEPIYLENEEAIFTRCKTPATTWVYVVLMIIVTAGLFAIEAMLIYMLLTRFSLFSGTFGIIYGVVISFPVVGSFISSTISIVSTIKRININNRLLNKPAISYDHMKGEFIINSLFEREFRIKPSSIKSLRCTFNSHSCIVLIFKEEGQKSVVRLGWTKDYYQSEEFIDLMKLKEAE